MWKKTFTVFLAFLFFLIISRPVFSVGNGLKEEFRGLKKEIENELKKTDESLNNGFVKEMAVTPAVQKRVTVEQKILERIWTRFPIFLPTQVSRAEIVAISSIELPCKIQAKRKEKTVTLIIDEKTEIISLNNVRMSLSELEVGDVVSAKGAWEDKEEKLLRVRILRDFSNQKKPKRFWEKIWGF